MILIDLIIICVLQLVFSFKVLALKFKFSLCYKILGVVLVLLYAICNLVIFIDYSNF